MTADSAFIAAQYRDAHIDLAGLGINVEHYRHNDGTIRAGIPLDDWLIVAQVFTARSAPRCICDRPIPDATHHRCTKCGKETAT